ncbi:MAG: hypothetical protein KF709_11805 [Gemmatimonadaceae bacterium]|nr:hypothetical protein [Gemmatimonadaceae bacterium]
MTAQSGDGPLRDGFFFSVGSGAASVSASCDGCTNDFFENRITGFSGNLQLGGSVSDRLVIAGEFSGWLGNEPPIYRRTAALSLVLIGYPSATSRFFFKSGVGAIRAIAEDDAVIVQTDAFLFQSGIGYDFPVRENSLTAYANYHWTFGGTTWVNSFNSPIVVLPNAIQFGLAFTVY